MNTLKIPYLGPDGHDWPQQLLDLPGVFASSYHRLPDISEKDANFTIFRENIKAAAYLEGKNWLLLTSGDMKSILRKWLHDSQQHGVERFLHLTVCYEVTRFRSDCELRAYVKQMNLNVYIL